MIEKAKVCAVPACVVILQKISKMKSHQVSLVAMPDMLHVKQVVWRHDLLPW